MSAGEVTDVMIDLETLGLKPGSTILAIGAVTFNTYRVKTYSAGISRESCCLAGLKEDPKTLEWWRQQSEEARAEAFGGKTTITLALAEFSAWLLQLPAPYRLWGNAASFDLKLLEAAYEACSRPVPWKYHEEMCFRTLKNMFPQVTPALFGGIKHTALADAIYQAQHASRIFDYIYKGVPHACTT